MSMINAPIPRIGAENPICIMSTKYREPDQIIHPYMFGTPEMKSTCLWLKNLPQLKYTYINGKLVEGREQKIANMPPQPDRGKIRSLTYLTIAEAMALQWGCYRSPIHDPQKTLFELHK